MAQFYVKIQNVSPIWNGKYGILQDCITSDWYNVLVLNTNIRLVLHDTEFKLTGEILT